MDEREILKILMETPIIINPYLINSKENNMSESYAEIRKEIQDLKKEINSKLDNLTAKTMKMEREEKQKPSAIETLREAIETLRNLITKYYPQKDKPFYEIWPKYDVKNITTREDVILGTESLSILFGNGSIKWINAVMKAVTEFKEKIEPDSDIRIKNDSVIITF